MRPMLDDIPLPQIQSLVVRDARSLAEHRSPEMDGSYFQDMGRHATAILVSGIASGPDSLGLLGSITEKFDAAEPVSFVSDIVTDAEIEQVLIDDFKTREIAGKPERFAYALVLREFLEPVEPEEVGILDDDILQDATDLIDDLVDGLDLSLDFTTGLERFVEPLTDLLGRLRALNQSGGG
jgi:hypothetical protein